MEKRSLKKATDSYSYLPVEGLGEAYEKMHLFDRAHTSLREAPLFINLDDAYALSQSSAGFRPEYLERLLCLIDNTCEGTKCFIKYGAFDWNEDYNRSAFDVLQELVAYIENTNPSVSLTFVLPKQKTYVLKRIEDALSCKLVLPAGEKRRAA